MRTTHASTKCLTGEDRGREEHDVKKKKLVLVTIRLIPRTPVQNFMTKYRTDI